jgi:arylsulfatase A-like enzyme
MRTRLRNIVVPTLGLLTLSQPATPITSRLPELPAPALVQPQKRSGEQLPNIIVIFADDLGYGDIGVYGATPYPTPHLDQLARDGIRFTDFYVTQPVCTASRAGLLTGCYPNRLGLTGALNPNSRIGLAPSETTIAELLKSKGYATGIIGKWHLGHLPHALPTRHGFDSYYGIPYSHDMWQYHPETPKAYPPLPLYENETVVDSAVSLDEINTLTERYTERAVQFIETNRERPFFLYLAHSLPHVPLGVSATFRGRSGAGLYGDVITEIDASVGTLRETLRRRGIDKNTLIIFTSDNGPWLSYGDHAGSSGGLREGKGTVWEGGIRVPFIAAWQGKIPQNRVCAEPTMTIDLLPTFATITGASLPPLPLDGKDISPLLLGKRGKTPHEALYFYYGNNQLQAIRSGKWKLVFPHTYRTIFAKPRATGGIPIKYQQARLRNPELYDLTTDRAETRDLAAAHPEIVATLTHLAERARTDLGDNGKLGSGYRPPQTAPPKPPLL